MKPLIYLLVFVSGLAALKLHANSKSDSILIAHYLSFKQESTETDGNLDLSRYLSERLTRIVTQNVPKRRRKDYFELAAPIQHINNSLRKNLSNTESCLLLIGMDSMGHYALGSIRFKREKGGWRIDEFGFFIPDKVSETPKEALCPEGLVQWSETVPEPWMK